MIKLKNASEACLYEFGGGAVQINGVWYFADTREEMEALQAAQRETLKDEPTSVTITNVDAESGTITVK